MVCHVSSYLLIIGSAVPVVVRLRLNLTPPYTNWPISDYRTRLGTGCVDTERPQ